ncbi:hypothetical protein BJ138DRAFT_1184258 [Hygrophoropsis aurantiaca]|uniref:Uncharacterized protein n=1 Tax=Hygrophoropsis aurantiaca TaxID=72124 RepID=A0ACB7ZS86_9AGAM|nr:hypothetical protein BJ138DRAFT_1184258 [Hygrophoropsis aurantiaca]
MKKMDCTIETVNPEDLKSLESCTKCIVYVVRGPSADNNDLGRIGARFRRDKRTPIMIEMQPPPPKVPKYSSVAKVALGQADARLYIDTSKDKKPGDDESGQKQWADVEHRSGIIQLYIGMKVLYGVLHLYRMWGSLEIVMGMLKRRNSLSTYTKQRTPHLLSAGQRQQSLPLLRPDVLDDLLEVLWNEVDVEGTLGTAIEAAEVGGSGSLSRLKLARAGFKL